MITFRDIGNDAELQSALEIRNESLYYQPFLFEEYREFLARQSERVLARRLACEDGTDNAYGILSVWQIQNPGVLSTLIYYRTLSSFIGLYRNFEGASRARDAYKLMVWIRSVHRDALQFLADEGFEENQRQYESCLELEKLDPELFNSIDRVKASGYEIIDLEELSRRHPDEWQHISWRLEMDIFKDVPMPEPFEEIPFDEFKQEIENPNLQREAVFFAMWEGRAVATSQLLPNRMDKRLSGTGLTGVLRDHRRKGLATALKLSAFKWALAHGVKEIYSDNEVNNPMYDLNQSLGFRYVWDWICLAKGLPRESCETAQFASEAG